MVLRRSVFMNYAIQYVCLNEPLLMKDAFWNIIGWIITVIISISGWLIAYNQINAQNKNNVLLETQRVRKELQVQTAEETIKHLFDIRQSLISPMLYLISLPIDLKFIVSTEYKNVPGKSWELSSNQLNELWKPTIYEFDSFIYFFDSKEVILNEFISSQNEFKSKYHVITDEIFKFIDYLRDFNYHKYVVHKISQSDLDELYEKCSFIVRLLDDIQSFMKKYNSSIQNAFLSDIFSYRIQAEVPTKK